MIESLIWIQWRHLRGLFLYLLIMSLFMFPDLIFPTGGASGCSFLFLIWVGFSMAAGAAGAIAQWGKGAPSFLHARPVTKPFIFCVFCSSAFLSVILVIAISLFAYLAYMALTFPDFTNSKIVFDPYLFFMLLSCISLFSFSIFLFTSIATMGLVIFPILAILLSGGLFILHKSGLSLNSLLLGLDPDESPVSLIAFLISSSFLFITSALWVVSFDELRDVKNRRWGRIILILSCITLLSIGYSSSLLIQNARNSFGTDIDEVIVNRNPTSVIAVIPGQRESRVITLSKASFVNSGTAKGSARSGIKRPSCRGECFQRIFSDYLKESFLIYYSDKPIWGKQIRLHLKDESADNISPHQGLHLKDESVDNISPHLSSSDQLSPPFSSPDGDRIAYLISNAAAHPSKNQQSLWIFKYVYSPLHDHVNLSNQSGAHFEPIGWTPDGYDFMLKRRGPTGEEIWAVDWVAEGARPFLEDFGEAIIAGEDLPEAGEWISLILPQRDQKQYELWLVDYRSNQNVQVGIFNEIPQRAWSDAGNWFSCWSNDKGLTIYSLNYMAGPQKLAVRSDVSGVRQMKWRPYGGWLAMVTSTSEAASEKKNLVVFDPAASTSLQLLSNFNCGKKQWGWLSESAIVYAQGKELRQVDISGKTKLITSIDTLE